MPLVVKTDSGIPYVCGGVGQTEEQAMLRAAKAGQFDMMVTFATHTGAYLADVNVEITDPNGNSVLNTSCDGPIMLVNFDKGGKYRVIAETGGKEISRVARIREGGKIANIPMRWSAKTVDMGYSPTMVPETAIAPETRPTETRPGRTSAGASR
jgi:hypothetical protein